MVYDVEEAKSQQWTERRKPRDSLKVTSSVNIPSSHSESPAGNSSKSRATPSRVYL